MKVFIYFNKWIDARVDMRCGYALSEHGEFLGSAPVLTDKDTHAYLSTDVYLRKYKQRAKDLSREEGEPSFEIIYIDDADIKFTPDRKNVFCKKYPSFEVAYKRSFNYVPEQTQIS